MPRARFSLALALLLLLTACHHFAAPGATRYILRVENGTDRAMVVSYEDGHGTGMLGTVIAGRGDRFILTDLPSPRITVRARSADGSVTAGPYPLTLNATTVTRLTLQ